MDSSHGSGYSGALIFRRRPRLRPRPRPRPVDIDVDVDVGVGVGVDVDMYRHIIFMSKHEEHTLHAYTSASRAHAYKQR